ncbi:DUF2189 domain-containing protein [uncultured Rhodoblastus sp.]|uniref:DUF2189 domain-containing protein n=1 Tax=uncultured Rhodoblastus sp. TaxID=543037 RepID=UPI0025DA13F1|nr:DUF2189 domain-containing protein [uncultured Rhodoblastus sp.]
MRRISFDDLRDALIKGLDDFGAFRDDVLFVCLLYPVAGIALALLTSNAERLPLLFPLLSGFALIGPFAAVWLYEMCRRRERGESVSWGEGFKAFASPAAASIFKLGLLLIVIFALWLAVALGIYALTIGPDLPTSVSSFVNDVFTTRAGWALIVFGVGVGSLFALLVLSISVISFPLLLDRPVSVTTAMATSIQAMRVNPGPMLAWGLFIAVSMLVGMIPVLIGLIVVLPVLGHAAWHLYRKIVV